MKKYKLHSAPFFWPCMLTLSDLHSLFLLNWVIKQCRHVRANKHRLSSHNIYNSPRRVENVYKSASARLLQQNILRSPDRKKTPSVIPVSSRCNNHRTDPGLQAQRLVINLVNQPTPALPLRQWPRPTGHQIALVDITPATRQKAEKHPVRSRKNTESQRTFTGQAWRATHCSLEIGFEKRASFERHGICFGWQRLDFAALFVPANDLGPAGEEGDEQT